MSFVTPHAPTAGEVSSCVQCGLCLPHCPTYRLTGLESASPRGRIAAMSAVIEGLVTVDEVFDERLSFCLGCRACEAVCPGLVPYGRLLEGARAELTEQRPSVSRRLRRIALGGLLASRPAIRFITAGAWFVQVTRTSVLLPTVGRRAVAGFRRLRPVGGRWIGRTAAAVGESRGRVGLLSGCVMDDWFPGVHDATVDLLTRAGFEVVVPSEQTCCGALAAHDGHAGDAERLAKVNVGAFTEIDFLVSDSAGCTAHLKEYGNWTEGGDVLSSKVRDVTEFVAGLISDGVLPTLDGDRGAVAVQDPCHLRHAQRIMVEPRAILRAAGFSPLDVDIDGICCGAAGVYSVLQPETSAELGSRKADEVRATGATVVASANPGCEMQLRAHLGAGFTVRHPIEMYRDALAAHGSTTG